VIEMIDKIETNMAADGLRDIAEGTVRFGIKAKDTLENIQIHSAFKEFCRIETDNNYTQGIKKLLEYYQADFKYEMIFEKLQDQAVALDNLRESVIELAKPKNTKEEEFDSF
jgi:hypothetical protein